MSLWDEEDSLIPPRPRAMSGKAVLTLVSFDALVKDHYPRPGDRIKQYVIDLRREEKWAADTCPSVDVLPHDSDEMAADDSMRLPCSHRSLTQWHYLCGSCDTCAAIAYATRKRDDILAWRKERIARPPICEDRDKLSDEVAPPWPWPELKRSPVLSVLLRKP